MMKTYMFFLALLLLALTTVTAQTPFSIGGYIESYYSYDFSKPISGDRPLVFNHARHNEFSINLALLDMRYTSEDMRARVALQTGTYAMSNYAAEPTLLQAIHEASAGFRIADGLWLDAGVLGSHIGLESAIGRDNWTLTRSLAAEYSPYYETGVRLEVRPSEQWMGRILVLNGWQNIKETNSNKAVGTQIQYTPSPDILLNWSTFLGNEAPDSVESQTRIFNDFYAQLTLASHLRIAVVFDIGMQDIPDTDKLAVWNTATLILQYELSPAVACAVRGEYFSDKNHVVFPADNIKSFSVNVDWHPADKVMARIEGRLFSSDGDIFITGAGREKQNSSITTSIGFTL